MDRVFGVIAVVVLAACGPGEDGPPGRGVGGGGGTTSLTGASCSTASRCAPFACSCGDGTFWNSARYCFNNACQGQAATCADACKGHQGGSGGGGGSSGAQVTGCSLYKYSNDYSVNAETYGSGSTRGAALADAQAQCLAASWASWFCSAALESCSTEAATPYSCSFEKYSSSRGATIRFHGSGAGRTAAKRAAVAACLNSGQWQGWFCSSGLLTCSPG